MLQGKENVRPATKIVIRLLNGLLCGCEYILVNGKTLFLVTDINGVTGQEQGSILPENTVYIPAGVAGTNFEIVVSDNNEHISVVLYEMREEGAKKRVLDANKVVTIGGIKLAWCHEGDMFADDLLLEREENAAPEEIEHKETSRAILKSWWLKSIALLAILGCISFASYTYLTETKRQINNLSTLLEYDTSNYNIIQGKDKLLYIVAVNEKSAAWAMQSMVRNPPPYRVKVVTAAAEEKRIAKWIASHWPQIKIHRISFEDPKKPLVELSAERSKLDSTSKDRFSATMLSAIPYASSVALTTIQDKTVINLAHQGLKKMSLAFTEINNGDSVTFIIRGAVDDGELERIKYFVNQYYQTWGTQYIQFALELKNDWLKGKSFKYGEHGYVKIAPGHWYFPTNVKKEGNYE